MKQRVLVFVLGVVVASASLGQPGQFATKQDVIGYWEMIPIPDAEEINKVDPWPMPYQWFSFYEDGTLATMGSSEHESKTTEDLESVFTILEDSRFTWEFEPGGFLVVTSPDISGYQEAWGVNVITEERSLGPMEVKPGDLLMTLAGGEDGGPIYFRHLRRVK